MPQNFDAGKLRNTVAIQAKTVATSPGDRGQPVISWNTIATVRAAIEGVAPFGDKADQAKQLSASATHQITMRYLSTLTEECHIVWGKRIFNIAYIWNHEERNAWLTLLVKEQKSGIT